MWKTTSKLLCYGDRHLFISGIGLFPPGVYQSHGPTSQHNVEHGARESILLNIVIAKCFLVKFITHVPYCFWILTLGYFSILVYKSIHSGFPLVFTCIYLYGLSWCVVWRIDQSNLFSTWLSSYPNPTSNFFSSLIWYAACILCYISIYSVLWM